MGVPEVAYNLVYAGTAMQPRTESQPYGDNECSFAPNYAKYCTNRVTNRISWRSHGKVIFKRRGSYFKLLSLC